MRKTLLTALAARRRRASRERRSAQDVATVVRPIAGTRLDISATGEVTPRARPRDHFGRRA